MSVEIKIIIGKNAMDLFKDKSFNIKWKELAQQTNKVTVIQEPSFVKIWYHTYEKNYQPVFVLGFDDFSKLVGLMPLAYSIKEDYLTHAGDHQAEYHGWLCKKDFDQSFLIQALLALRDSFNLKVWQWRWLPPGSSINWLFVEELKRAKIYVRINNQDSPLLDIHDEEKIRKLSRNKSIKTKINRYKNNNKLRLERIYSVDRAKELFDVLADQCDFRQMAVHRVTPFASDNNKKHFYISRLIDPESNHFTVLWSHDIPIAFHFGACDSNTVYLGLSGYNPCEERNSPGSILWLKLIELLREEGYRYLDLTPGGDQYKERYSNSHQRLYMPTFYFSRSKKLLGDLKHIIRETIKNGLKIFGIDLTVLRRRIDTQLYVLKKGLTTSPKITIHKLISSICHRRIFTLYRLLISDRPLHEVQDDSTIRINSYSDLLKYNDSSYWISKRDLLSNSLKQFSNRASLYTVLQNETLAHFGWMISGNSKNLLSETGFVIAPADKSILINGIVTNPNYLQEEFFINVIKSVIALNKSSNTEEIYILHTGNKGAIHNAIKLAGFEVYGRMHRLRILWIVRKRVWSVH